MIAALLRGGLAFGLSIGLLTGWSVISEGPRVAAHSQLVTSVPGAGVVLNNTPPELRLVFVNHSRTTSPPSSSWISGARWSRIDAHVSTSDSTVLLASLPTLEDGAYTANWRAFSSADGHVTAGFISFEIGDPVFASPGHFDHSGLGGLEGLPKSGSLHAGHTSLDATFEISPVAWPMLASCSRSGCWSSAF